MKKPFTIAVPKGYLMEETITILEGIGISFRDSFKDTRRLFGFDSTGQYKMLVVRPWDVPAYVSQGAADLGIAGQDVLAEQEPDVMILRDCHFGACKLVIAGQNEMGVADIPQHCTVVTKYPSCTEKYFKKIGKKAKIIKLYGAIELGPLTGLSDFICDLTATGATLKEHDLKIIDTVLESTAYLIANPVGMRIHYDHITGIMRQLTDVI